MGPTLDELHRRVRGKLSTTGTKFFTPTIVTDLLNEAHDTICTEAPWTLETTFQTEVVSGSGRYAMPPRVIHPTAGIIKLSAGSECRLHYRTPDIMEMIYRRGGRGNGTPRWISYNRLRDTVYAEIWPAPSPTYSGYPLWLRANVYPTPMVELTDRSEFPRGLAQASVAYAVWQLKKKAEDHAGAQEAASEFGDALTTLEQSRLRIDADQFPYVTDGAALDAHGHGGGWSGGA